MEVVVGLATVLNSPVGELLQLDRDEHELPRVLNALRTLRCHSRLSPVVEPRGVLELSQPRADLSQLLGLAVQPDDGQTVETRCDLRRTVGGSQHHGQNGLAISDRKTDRIGPVTPLIVIPLGRLGLEDRNLLAFDDLGFVPVVPKDVQVPLRVDVRDVRLVGANLVHRIFIRRFGRLGGSRSGPAGERLRCGRGQRHQQQTQDSHRRQDVQPSDLTDPVDQQGTDGDDTQRPPRPQPAVLDERPADGGGEPDEREPDEPSGNLAVPEAVRTHPTGLQPESEGRRRDDAPDDDEGEMEGIHIVTPFRGCRRRRCCRS
ncbi:hypothetical protein B7Y92_02125 [Candidatus Saccharibacteria bacterium 32-50-13]|nr:MAG: hypothetical protein B7Y92_02125 [Candidatus Saccharibacteria bacterium 32-50-13]